MGVVVLTGGLGNQLFQICYALHLRQFSAEEVTVDYKSKPHRLAHGLGSLEDILELVELNSYENRDTYSHRLKLAVAIFLRSHAHRLKLNNPEQKTYSTAQLTNRVHVGYWQNDPRIFEQYTSLAKVLADASRKHHAVQPAHHRCIRADVALDPYTTHGHDGIIENGEILNDPTVEILCKQALVQAQAGADIIRMRHPRAVAAVKKFIDQIWQ